jgi:uncharacterized protein (DUF342 family)
VGAPSGVATTFEMGVDPTVAERVKFVNERVKALETEQVKLSQIIQLLYPLKTADKLPKDKAEMLEKAMATKSSHDDELKELQAERETLSVAMEGGSASQFVCKRELYYGTKVTICQIVYTVPSDLIRCKIYLNPQREITMVSL